MKQENKKPLYKVLYEETGDDNLAVGMKALDQYRELATENLHHLAEALEGLLSMDISQGKERFNLEELTFRDEIKKAKEALNRIS